MSNSTLSFATIIDTSGYEKGIERMSQATKVIDSVLKDIDVSSLSDKFGTLDEICQEYNQTISAIKNQMQGFALEIEKAVTAGDTDAFNAAAKEMEKLSATLETTTQEAQPYRDALAMVAEQLGIIANTPKPPMFFTQEELTTVEALQNTITSLNVQLSNMEVDDAGYKQLKTQLDDATNRLNSMELSAAKTAASLGSDLGGRASEASERLYELNQTVSDQEAKIKELRIATEMAAKSLEQLNAASSDTEAIARAQATYDAYVQSLHDAELQLQAMQGAQVDARDALTRVSAEVQAHDSIMVKMLGGQEKYTQIVSNLPGPLQSVIGGINGMTGAAKSFIATPLGAVIAAIVLALQAVSTWLNSSVDGQLKLAEMSGRLSGVLGQLKEIVINVGKIIFDAFSNPKKAAKDFIDFLKSQVMNRIKAAGEVFGALGRTIANVFSGDFDAAKESLKEMGSAYADFLTGVENSTGKIADWAHSVKDAADATGEISRANRELEIQVSEWQQRKNELEQKKQEARMKMYDTSLTRAEQQKAMADFKAALNEQMEQERKFADQRIALQERAMSLTTNTIEDENELRNLKAARQQLETQFQSELTSLQRMQNRIDKAVADPTNKIEKADDKYAREQARILRDAEFSAAQARIDAMAEGEEKTLAQMQLNHVKELEELEREKEDYLQKRIELEREKFNSDPKNKGKHFDASAITLTDEEEAMFAGQKLDVKNRHQREEQEYFAVQRQAMDEYLKEWGTFQERKEAITRLANDKMQKATSEGERLSIAAQLEKDLSDLDMEANKKTNAIAKLFGDMSEKSVTDLRKIADDGQKALDMLTSGNYDAELGKALNISPETFSVLAKSPEELEKIRKAIKDITNEADSLDTPLKKIENGLDKIFNAGDNKKKLDQGLAELFEGINEVMKGVQVLTDAFSALGDAFGSDLMKGVADGLNTAMNAVNSAMQGAQAGAMFGPIGAAAGAAIGLVGSLASSLAKLHDSKHEKNIEKIQKRIDNLKNNYDSLGRSIEKAYSKKAAGLIDEQNKMLRQQKALIQQQIAEEKSKKNADEDRLKEMQQQIEEIDRTIEDNKEKAIDAIFGEDVKAAIDHFADAYASMFDDGISKARASKNIVKDMIKQMIVEAMKQDISEPMKKLRAKMDELWTDGYISANEEGILNDMAEKMMADLESQYSWADKYFKNSYSQSSTSGGFQTMSQDTADELNGRFTSMQMTLGDINQSLQSVVPNIERIQLGSEQLVSYAQELSNIGLLQLAELEVISNRCKTIYEMSESLLTKIERNTREL